MSFLLQVFSWIIFPQAPESWQYQWRCFNFYRKFAEIFPAHGAPPVLLTLEANWKKLSSKKVLNILFGHFLVVGLTNTVDTSFFFKLTIGYKQSDIFAIIFATIWWIDYLPPVSTTPLANLPPLSTTPEVPAVDWLPVVADFPAVLSIVLLLAFLLLPGSRCCWHPFSYWCFYYSFGVPSVVDISYIASVSSVFSTRCCCSDVAVVLLFLTSVLILVFYVVGVSSVVVSLVAVSSLLFLEFVLLLIFPLLLGSCCCQHPFSS